MLKRTLSRSANADPNDVPATKRALAAVGLHEIPEWGLTSFPDEAMSGGFAVYHFLQPSRHHGSRMPIS